MAAAVAAIALTASPDLAYSVPGSVCALVRPATVAKYLPGPAHAKSAASECQWSTGTTGLVVYASVFDSAAQVRKGFTQVIQATGKANMTKRSTVTGTRAVTGLGDKATAMFVTSALTADPGKRGGSVTLFVASGNAVIQVIRIDGNPGDARQYGPALLPGAIAIAREVLAAMPTLGPGSPGVGVHITLDVSHPVGGVILGDPRRGDQHRWVAE